MQAEWFAQKKGAGVAMHIEKFNQGQARAKGRDIRCALLAAAAFVIALGAGVAVGLSVALATGIGLALGIVAYAFLPAVLGARDQ